MYNWINQAGCIFINRNKKPETEEEEEEKCQGLTIWQEHVLFNVVLKVSSKDKKLNITIIC